MNLTYEEHQILIDWIQKNFIPIKTFNDKAPSSYGLKHIFEHSENGFYIDNECFKHAMLECGFKARNEKELNWIFNISQKSPAVKNRYKILSNPL